MIGDSFTIYREEGITPYAELVPGLEIPPADLDAVYATTVSSPTYEASSYSSIPELSSSNGEPVQDTVSCSSLDADPLMDYATENPTFHVARTTRINLLRAPSSYEDYWTLLPLMDSTMVAIFPDGSRKTKQQLCLDAIKKHRWSSPAREEFYFELSKELAQGVLVEIPGLSGSRDKFQLATLSVRAEQARNYSEACVYLGRVIGDVKSSRVFFISAIQKDINYGRGYFYLGRLLAEGESITIDGVGRFTKDQLLQRAKELKRTTQRL